MSHRIHPVTQTCELCGAMAHGIENERKPCSPEPGWYWARLRDSIRWHDADVWVVVELIIPESGHRVWAVADQQPDKCDAQIAEIGPRIKPLAWMSHSRMNREPVPSIDSQA